MLYFIFVILVLYLILRIKRSYNDPVWRDMPGPTHTWPIFGFAFNIINSDFSVFHSMWAKQYGPIFRYYVLGFTTVMVSDPALVKYVLLNNTIFDKDMFHYRFISRGLGKGLVTEWDEEKHKYHRSIISPAFAHHHLRALVPIFQQKGAILIDTWMNFANSNKPINIKQDVARATSDVIGESAFSCQFNSQTNDSSSSIYNIFDAVMGDGFTISQVLPVLKYLSPAYHTRINAIKSLNNQVHMMVRQKEQEKQKRIKKKGSSEKDNNNNKRDLLDLMMECQSEEGAVLSREELVDQTKTFLMAGYETVSVCIQWTMYLLAKHTRVQDKLAEEIIRVLGKNKQPTAENIDEMPYLYKVLRESLRYFPPVPLVARRANQDVELGGFKITKGTIIAINIFHLHRHGTVWDKPEEFNPDRWQSSIDDSSETHLLGSFIPFIMGARNCIGNKFATLEVRVILAMIIQNFKCRNEPGSSEPRPMGKITLAPRTPIRLFLDKRE